MEAYSRSELTKSFPQGGKFQNGDTGDHQDIPPTKGVGFLDRLQGCLLPYTNTGTVQEISEISCPGSNMPIQSTALRFVHSTHGVHCNSKAGETDGHTQGYKNPPVPRRLVGEGQIPPGLSPTYTRSSKNVSTIRLTGELRQIRTGSQADFQLCMLPVQPQVRSGPTDTGPVAEPSGENTETAILTGLSSPGIHVLDRLANSQEKQVLLGDPNSQVPAPPLTMVATRRQCTHRPTITPNKTCSAKVYRRIKRRVGHSLK